MAAVFLLLLLVGGAHGVFYSPHVDEQQAMWDEYKIAFGKDYQNVAEDARRKAVFLVNLQLIDNRNALEEANGGEPVHGLTHLVDMSQDEYERLMLSDKTAVPSAVATEVSMIDEDSEDVVKDWQGSSTMPVRDQGLCASGYAFSAAAQIESDTYRELVVRNTLSPEQLLACDAKSFGCAGGTPESAYLYVRRAGGLERESTAPYMSSKGKTPSCAANENQFVVGLSGAFAITGPDPSSVERSVAYYVSNTGPLNVCIDATALNTYVGGVITVSSPGSTNHCLQVVGLSVKHGQGWWRLRNSFGSSWGEAGFVRVAYGGNVNGITTRPTFVSIEREDSTLRQEVKVFRDHVFDDGRFHGYH